LEPTEFILNGGECTRKESWNLPSMYLQKGSECNGRRAGTYRI